MLVVVFLIVCAVFAALKSGLFEDESWTYFLANGLYVGNGPENGVLYHNGEPYRSWASVEGFLGIDFTQLLQSVGDDNHPPLYFLLFSLAYSLFPGSVAPQIGVMLNAIFLAASLPFVYGAAKRLGAQPIVALAITAGWAFSVGTIDTAVFLRMYALLTLMFCALTFVVVGIITTEVPHAGWFVGLFAVCLLGFLTQYFFLLYAFVLCLLAGAYLLWRRRKAQACAFGLSAIAGVCVGIALFPASIDDLFASSRGTEALSAAAEGSGFFDKLIRDWGWVSSELFAGILPFVVFVVIVLVAAAVVIMWRRRCEDPRAELLSPGQRESLFVLCIVALAACAFVVLVARVAPYASNRYLLAVYPALYLSLFLVAARTLEVLLDKQSALISAAALGVFALVFCLVGFATVGPRYLHQEKLAIEKQSQSHTTSVVLWQTSPDDRTVFPYVLEYGDNLYFDNIEALKSYDLKSLGSFTLFIQSCYNDGDVAWTIKELTGRQVLHISQAGDFFTAYVVS